MGFDIFGTYESDWKDCPTFVEFPSNKDTRGVSVKKKEWLNSQFQKFVDFKPDYTPKQVWKWLTRKELHPDGNSWRSGTFQTVKKELRQYKDNLLFLPLHNRAFLNLSM